MARYIDADLLRDEMEDLYEHHLEMKNFSADDAVSDCLYFLDNAPTADVVEVKQIEIIRDDLKWWLETNNEKGVVHIPKYIVENMIAKMDGERKDT